MFSSCTEWLRCGDGEFKPSACYDANVTVNARVLSVFGQPGRRHLDDQQDLKCQCSKLPGLNHFSHCKHSEVQPCRTGHKLIILSSRMGC